MKINKIVGIITLHRVVNYGSVLQTYALQEIIKKIGLIPEVIDYYPKRLTRFGMLKRIKNKGNRYKKSFIIRNVARLIIMPSYILRFNTFFSFLQKFINLSKKTYKDEESINKEIFNYDIYCTGSDQVWNSGWNEKIDHPYFLTFAPDDKKKIAYAASFGKKELDEFEIEETRKMLKRYDSISVREKSGVNIVKSLGIENVENVVDPTLLLTGDDWRKISSNKYMDKKYILVYNLNRNKKIDNYAKSLSEKTGLKIIYLSYQLHEFYKKGKMVCNPKVEHFISLIDNATYVITDSFHATSFSLNLNTQFIIVYPGKYSTRLQSILELLNLENRVAKNENELDIIKNEIDYKMVNENLKKMRNDSINWLKNALL